jgi:hypothetical protein
MKTYLQFLVVIAVTLTQSYASAASDWWWHTSYTSTDTPPKYCVRDGIFSGPVRCMDYEKAKAIGFDDRKVLEQLTIHR